MTSSMRHILFLLLSLALAATTVPALSDDGHDEARAALQRGEIKPLGEILAKVQKEVPGEVIEVEFERDDGKWIYEIKAIDPAGRYMKIIVDAASNTILRVKRKHENSDR